MELKQRACELELRRVLPNLKRRGWVAFEPLSQDIQRHILTPNTIDGCSEDTCTGVIGWIDAPQDHNSLYFHYVKGMGYNRIGELLRQQQQHGGSRAIAEYLKNHPTKVKSASASGIAQHIQFVKFCQTHGGYEFVCSWRLGWKWVVENFSVLPAALRAVLADTSLGEFEGQVDLPPTTPNSGKRKSNE